MQGISFSGLASGLDSASIITQIMKLERIPIEIMEAKKSNEKVKLAAIGAFESLVSALKDKAEELSSNDTFYVYNVGMSQEGLITATAGTGAVAGSHTIDVTNTAATDRWAFDGVTDRSTDLGTADGQVVSFDVNGTSYSLTLNEEESTLDEIASAINTMADGDVTASVVNVGTDASPSYQLVLASDDSGEDARISNITSTIAGLTIDGTAPDGDGDAGSANNVTVGTNAVAIIDGLTVTREDNDFSDVIPGVTVDLLSADPGNEVTFTVEADRDAVKDKVQEFVDSYNEVIDYINDTNTYTEDDGGGGALFGDSILSSVRRHITDSLFNVDIDTVMADTTGFSTLSLVGIDTDSDGRLSIDSTTMDEKMAEDLDAFADLFVDTDGFTRLGSTPNTEDYFIDSTTDSGLAALLERRLDRIMSDQEGPEDSDGDRINLPSIFDNRTDALNINIDRYTDQIENKERLLEIVRSNLERRFANLEKVMAQLNAMGAALQNGLPNMFN